MVSFHSCSIRCFSVTIHIFACKLFPSHHTFTDMNPTIVDDLCLHHFMSIRFNISETLYPKKIFLMCPKCNGLFVFGEEYSTIYIWPDNLDEQPNISSFDISRRMFCQYLLVKVMFKNPLTIW